MAIKPKQKSPSREKYEAENPTVSFRVNHEMYERLQSAKKHEGKSFADIMKIGLGLMETKVLNEKEIRESSHKSGYEEGHVEGMMEFGVTYTCSVCGDPVAIESNEEKEAAAEYMEDHEWAHAKCRR